ncbi:thiol reductant ABC exporter subunit CydD [Nocardioides limicola]|uniref:thiol reductant ABC exporter subunit CydD n=1 Tax=Nocardioides limicola TaxID=2803368 RepID=UPI00193C339F|nr:thiol reductant ABC exporter subunit CydD [Nocardioides sp. DJM-14]
MKPLDPALLPHLRPARGWLGLVVTGSVLGGLLVVGQAFAVAAVIVGLIRGDDPLTPVLWLLGLAGGRMLLSWTVDVAAARAAAAVAAGLRRRVLHSALARTNGDPRTTGELTALATRGVASIEPYLTRYLPALVVAAVLPVLVVVAMVSQDLIAGLLVVVTLPLIPVFAVLIGLNTRDQADRQWRAMADLAGHFLDIVRGLPTLVAHRRGAAQAETILTVSHRHRRETLRTLRLAFASSAVLELVATLSVALVAVIVGLRLATGGLELQVALTVLLLAPEAYWPLRRVGAEFHAAAEGTATFTEVNALTDPVAPQATGRTELPGPIRLNGVGLTWPGRDDPAVQGLDAVVAPTGITAIRGPSGCGKSTLLQALLGELTPNSGSITVGDLVLGADLDAADWQRHVAQAPQRPWLTPDTIATNLRVGRPDADDPALWDALARVELDQVVRALPDGLDTRLGDDGAGLSAGQRARLALARVVLADRPWVILDEPTAHLDAASEATILATLTRLAEDRAVIVVAHRSAVVEAADQVITLAARPSPTPALQYRAGQYRAGEHPRPEPTPAPRPAPSACPDTDPTPDHRTRGRWVLAIVLSVLATMSGIALAATAGWLIVRAAEQPPLLTLTVAIVGVRTFGIARPALRYVERLLAHDVALAGLAQHRSDVYRQLVPLVPGRLNGRADSLTAVVDDVDALVEDRLRVRLPQWTWLGVTVTTTALGWLILPTAAGVLLAVCLTGPVAYLLARATGAATETSVLNARGDLGRRVHQVIVDGRQVGLWQAEERAVAGVDEAGRALARTQLRSAMLTGAVRTLPLLAATAGLVAMVGLTRAPYAAGALSGPVVALLVLTPLALLDLLTPLADAGSLRVRTRAARARLDRLVRQRPAVTDPLTPRPLPQTRLDVTLDQVSASWDDQRRALTDFTVSLPPGAHVGITGPSGSGKSTAAAVLMRYLSPTDGSHRVNGIDARSATLAEVRERVATVDDDPYIFASSVAENVRFARPGADDAEVAAALTDAHLGDWLAELPHGLATRVGDGGLAVSGGERTRIGLARALLADPELLVLDEPTAHLDGDTARAVVADVLDLFEDRSVVWIAHDRVGLDAMDTVLSTAPATPR